MPIYEYECSNCGKRFEKIQSMTADSITECINCGGGPIRRVLHPVGIIFKGSGWYKTDSRKSGSSEGSSTGKDDKATPAKQSDGGSTSSDSPGKDAPASKPAT